MDDREFTILYSNFLEKINSENKKAIILGDFNLDLIKASADNNIKDFLETNLSNYFIPHITRPTRITPYSKTLIDNIFTNFSQQQDSCNLICSISDHLPQAILFDIKTDKKTPRQPNFKRDYSNFNIEDFLLDFISFPWDKKFQHKNPSNRLKFFIDTTNSLIEQHVPLKKVSSKLSTSKPWLTKGLLKSISTKNKLYKKFLKSKRPDLKAVKHQAFKTHRNLLSKLLHKAKSNYYKDYFETNKTNFSLIWKAINQISGAKSKDDSSPSLLIHEGHHIEDKKEIAEACNNYFGTIAEKTKDKIPATNKVFTDFLGNPCTNSFFLNPTTPIAIQKLILEFDDKKSSGPNSIPIKILKLISPTASTIFSSIINECFQTGTYPSCLKKACVKPLHKKNSRLEVGNYRPISLLSNVNKIFEKVIHTRLTDFFEKKQHFFQESVWIQRETQHISCPHCFN